MPSREGAARFVPEKPKMGNPLKQGKNLVEGSRARDSWNQIQAAQSELPARASERCKWLRRLKRRAAW
ncbi:hypothetical protein COW36_12745 [bacterium (Candidatus Blackallbacteria) CG17_big_fil_post_rev_8_21_14_2_50_48_46]|uniref:Uncharacterized protein n=1 Tax=bacterium (Candidatus Blackallbacteria) CG17_big_fil_post_rev_8_21_14_2_50_48_46 TaxID=2014261 RepID=A0A2M7G451_9BACT|nr:MAG: hypothetical protein COW36_12745 [bacterium (Candidatus Blackallbacteria) CG17_big_fil_post_rev_8_21_14_2_50_48_46]